MTADAAIDGRGLAPEGEALNSSPMSKTRSEVLSESKVKGAVAGATTAAAVTLGIAVSVPLGVVAAVPALVLGYRWWKHRAENGIRF